MSFELQDIMDNCGVLGNLPLCNWQELNVRIDNLVGSSGCRRSSGALRKQLLQLHQKHKSHVVFVHIEGEMWWLLKAVQWCCTLHPEGGAAQLIG